MGDRRNPRGPRPAVGGMPWRTPGEKVRTVALSAAAVGAIYTGGYLVVTTPAVSGMAPSEVILELAPPAPAGEYRDGTYTGTASNTFGSVTVAVTITGGQISRVEITGSTALYPQSYIDGLPDQVINTQSADVPVVSGATASWQDFVQATQRALQAAAGGQPDPADGG